MDRKYVNPNAARTPVNRYPGDGPLRFHRKLPGYSPGPLVRLDIPGPAEVWMKDESFRFGLPAFKILGASWAVYRKLLEGRPVAPDSWDTIQQFSGLMEGAKPDRLVTATDGNHGRAVARMARWLSIGAHIFMPAGSSARRVEAIESEGAKVSVVSGDYDDAVAAAAGEGSDSAWLIQDTAWPGYEKVPGWIVEGYSTIVEEIDKAFDMALVQIGVGSLAAALVSGFEDTIMVGVEPSGAACAFESAVAGEPVNVPGPHNSIMAGLNCGTVSSTAWPLLSGGVDLFVAIDDHWAEEAMRRLAAAGIEAGESGAAGLGALLYLLSAETSGRFRPRGRVLVILTEGITDPEVYDSIVKGQG